MPTENQQRLSADCGLLFGTAVIAPLACLHKSWLQPGVLTTASGQAGYLLLSAGRDSNTSVQLFWPHQDGMAHTRLDEETAYLVHMLHCSSIVSRQAERTATVKHRQRMEWLFPAGSA